MKKIVFKILENNFLFTNNLSNRLITRRIVIHHSASDTNTTIDDIHRWHLGRGWSGIGYHYVIYPTGVIYRGRPERKIGAHAYQDKLHEANTDGIGICLIGNFMLTPPTNIQLQALIWLINDIRKRYPNLPIIGHKDVQPTACPGNLFSFEKLKTELLKGVIDIETWQYNLGIQSLESLKNKGIITSVDEWKTKTAQANQLPGWLIWTLLDRIAGGK